MAGISYRMLGGVILLILVAAPVAAQEDTQSVKTQLDTGLRPSNPSGLQTNPMVNPINVTPMKRLDTRLSNRVQSRINSRIQHVRGSGAKAPTQRGR